LRRVKPFAQQWRNLSVIMDLLVSYPRGYYGPARQEIVRILGRFGDPEPRVEKSGVPGVSVVHTGLDNRQVIARCAELYQSDPGSFRFAIKWVPVDYWCAKDLDAIRRVIEEHVAPCIGAEETWGMQVEKRGWAQYHTAEIIERLAGAIDRKVRLTAPDRLVRIDILGNAVAASVLRRGEIFSVYAFSP
jgi:tRNA(Ser,Leu) C12 N-acetylase TAN1